MLFDPQTECCEFIYLFKFDMKTHPPDKKIDLVVDTFDLFQ